MQLCRFNHDRLGLIDGEYILDVSDALDVLPTTRWLAPQGDPLVLHLDRIRTEVERLRPNAPSHLRTAVSLFSPLVSPTKIMAAPANYKLHVQLDAGQPGIDHGFHAKALEGVERPVDKYGLFLKATSSLSGESEGVQIVFPDRRTDHEIELAVVIGKPGRDIPREQAMAHVAGYTIGLDMTVRGAEERSYRKSADTYTVLGPAFVTADEISDPHALRMSLWVNGERRQHSSTGAMTVDIPDLIAFASRAYALNPGDVILTGTPEGVGPVLPGDVVRVACDSLGEMEFHVRRRDAA